MACLHAQHTHRRWPASGEIFAYVWGNFCARPELRKRRKNFCARPRKIVRTPPNKFAYANFAYVQQNFVRKRTEPKFCVRPENFAYVHERTKNLFVRPRKILRTSRKILRTSKKFCVRPKCYVSEVPHDLNKFLACAQEACCCSSVGILRTDWVCSWGWRDCCACIFVIGSASLGLL